MKSITKNMRLLIVGAGLGVLASLATGCSNKMGCPGKITLEKTAPAGSQWAIMAPLNSGC